MRKLSVAAVAASLFVFAAAAQQAAPPGPGPQFGRAHTPGWSMMTPKERDEHRQQMLGVRNAEECRTLRDAHVQRMQERARGRGMMNMPMPQQDMCAGMPG